MLKSKENISKQILSGLLLVSKPRSWSSAQIISVLKYILDTPKIGHTGTLDPFAEGLLLLFFGKATKLINYLDIGHKTYVATMRLGFVSDTFDCEGKISEFENREKINKKMVEKVITKYIGEILQMPPKFSALKVKGRRAYDLARQGIDFELDARKIKIFDIKLLNYSQDELEIEVKCSKGTYIRSLANDIGLALGSGAYLTKLVRTEIGNFKLDKKVIVFDKKIKRETFIKSFIPINKIELNLEIINLNKNQKEIFEKGIKFEIDSKYQNVKAQFFQVRYHDDLLGICILENNFVIPKKVFI